MLNVFDNGPFYNRLIVTRDEFPEYRHHIRTLVRYAVHMGLPIDYWETWNEPENQPFWHGTTEQCLALWDVTYDTIRSVHPEAMIVGLTYTRPDLQLMTAFLDHCRENGQRLDVLCWHDFNPPGQVRRNIVALRRLVETDYSMLGVKEYHIDEWKGSYEYEGPGTHIAFFYYMDLAGLDRACRTAWTEGEVYSIRVAPSGTAAMEKAEAEKALAAAAAALPVKDEKTRHF